MGKSFEVGYKVKSPSYNGHYTWAIQPRMKDVIDKVVIKLKVKLEYKTVLMKSLQKMAGKILFRRRYE